MKTKKNKSTKLLKIGILFFGISLLLWNCEKDENSHDHQEHQIAKIDYLNIEELPEVASVISGLNNLGSKNNNTASRSMSTDFGSLNLTSILEYANNDGKLTYSFLIDKENSSNTPYSFENLHLVKVENGFFGYILKWEPNEQWIEANDFNFSIQNFTGTQTHYDLDYNVIQIAELNNGQIVNNLVGKTISNRSNQNRRYMEYICTSIFGDLCTDTGASYCGGSICGFGVKTSCSWQEAGGGSATGGSDNDSGNGTNGESESGGGGTRIPRNNDSSDVDVANGDAIVVPIPPSYEDYFDKHIFIDQDFKDKPCLKAVYNAMGKATKFKEYLQNFENDMSVADLRFTTDDNFSGNEDADYHNAMAITKPPLTSNEIKIKFNTDPNTTGNILNKPDVFKAVSMIHEIIHAEMYRKMLDAMIVAQGAGTTLDWTNLTYDEFRQYIDVTLQNKYFGIWDYYVRYDDNDDTPDNGQHQQMAQHYRDIVKQALTDYDPTLTEEQKEALSWIGLNEANIVAWQNLDENPNLNTQQEQAAINSTITQIKNTFPNECN